MPRVRDLAREKAREMWEASGRTLKLREIAERLNIPEKTISGWKSKDGWDKKNERSTPKKKRSTPNCNTPHPGTPTVEQQLAAAVDENEKLTAQQKDFCLYYNRIKNKTQAYVKAYGCSYATAMSEGSRITRNPKIKEELRRLREITVENLDEICGADVIEMHMRIAFADITDFMEFKGKTAPVLHKGEVVMMEHPKTHEMIPVTETVNTVQLKNSTYVDGQLINEVSQGKDSVKVKLADRQKSLDFLARYFELNPMDRHRKEYQARKIELELAKAETQYPSAEGDSVDAKSNFNEALTSAGNDAWDSEDEK